MSTAYFSSPIGLLEVQSNGTAVTSIKFLEQTEDNLPREAEDPVINQCFQQLDEYFKGIRKAFSFPMYQEGTDFQKQVWSQLCTIPYGKTISYADLSKQLGDIKKIRAVGTTNGKNKLAIVVPCHRVIGSNQQLTGYAGGLWRKRWLLDHESGFTQGVRQLNLI